MKVLTGAEIKDLAEFAGFVLLGNGQPEGDELETEYVIEDCPERGIANDEGVVEHFAHVAYLYDYPEEGVLPLGAPQ